MSDINVIWKSYDPNSPPNGYWCYGFLEEIFELGPTPSSTPRGDNTFYHGYDFKDIPTGEGAIVVVCVPPEYQIDYVENLNASIQLLPWSVLIIASDEQGRFPVEELNLPDTCKLWVMTPHFEKHDFPVGTQFLGEMYPQQARANILETGYLPERPYRWSFSGQITHDRRREMVTAIQDVAGGRLNKTAGFTQGLGHRDYYSLLNESISVPSPSGPVTPDSFRAFEALEAGCIPILDGECPTEQDCIRYWKAVFGEHHPLPVVHDWADAEKIVEDNSDVWPTENIRIYSWWQMFKRELRLRILSGVPDFETGRLTILMPTSTIPSHPSTEKIEQVIESVRIHHPTADIIIMCDGIRDEQLDRTDDYNAYLVELLDACNFKWRNVYPIVFEEFSHQANMARSALDYVYTSLVMYVEHDISLTPDQIFDWEGIYNLVESGEIDALKFSFETMGIHPEHEHMALDPEVIEMQGVPVRRTIQWSQRPHVCRTAYYRWMIEKWFPPTNRTMIEDRMHSVGQEFPELVRIATYMPGGNTNVRCFHIDGREDDEKYGMIYE